MEISVMKKKAARGVIENQARCLRIGVVQGGRVIEERLHRGGRKITVGRSSRNTIVLPSDSAPARTTLFQQDRGRCRLVFGEEMDGRIAREGEQVMTLAETCQRGLAVPAQDRRYELPLDENTRGKVTLGETTLLFQLVIPPPERPQPQLPASVRGGLFRSMDWVLACCFVTMSVLHCGFIVYLKSVNVAAASIAEAPLDLGFVDYIPQPDRKVLDLVQLTDQGEKQVKADPGQPPRKKPDPGTRSPGPASRCDRECQVRRIAEHQARAADVVNKVIGTIARGGASIAPDLMESGSSDQKLEEAFKGVKVASSQSVGGGMDSLIDGGGPGTRDGVNIDPIGDRVGGPDEVSIGGEVVEKVPRARVRPERIEVTDGVMNTDETYRVIRRSMSCVKAAYQRSLTHAPKLQGKLSLCFTVDPMGRVAGIREDLDSVGDPKLTSGVKTCVSRLRFTPPKEGTAEVCVPFVLTPAQ